MYWPNASGIVAPRDLPHDEFCIQNERNFVFKLIMCTKSPCFSIEKSDFPVKNLDVRVYELTSLAALSSSSSPRRIELSGENRVAAPLPAVSRSAAAS